MKEMLELTITLHVIFIILVAIIIIRLTAALWQSTMKQIATPARMIDDLPSVSVCIPARNETHAMTACLESVLASNYPKLEVVVLDDGSTDNTSFLIKSFAHEGVRFVEGSPLMEGWLGKNHALHGLLAQASGTYVLFIDVDTRMKPDTIEQLVAYMEQEQAAMVSILPQRHDSLRASTLFSPLRYLWELVLNRRSLPAAASALWMINRHVLQDELGGLVPFALDTQPESKIAATLVARGNNYKFLVSTPLLGVSYEKKWMSQVETSIRLLYPRLGGRAWSGMLGLLVLLMVWLPIGQLVSSLLLGWTSLVSLSVWSLVLTMLVYGLYLSRVRQAYWWVAMLLWPVILTQEIILLILSMIKYARGTVTWKGRSVIAPKTVRRMKRTT